MKAYLIIAVFSVWLFSCVNAGEKGDDGLKNIDFYAAEQRRIYTDELFDKVEIIPLETTPDCFLQGSPFILGLTNDYVILSNTFNNACLFDRKSGRFIHNIGKQGGGPDEYYMLSSAGNFYKEKGLIYATRGNKWIGINIESNKVEDQVAQPDIAKDGILGGISNPYRLNDSLYIGYMNNLTGNEKYRLIIFDRNGTPVKFYKNTIFFTDYKKTEADFCQGNFYYYKNDFYFYGGIFIDTIYAVKNDDLEPRYAFKLNKTRFPYEKWETPELRLVDYTTVMDFREYDPYLLFTYRCGEFGGDAGFGVGFYDKEKNKTVLSKKEEGAIFFRDNSFPPFFIHYMDDNGYVIAHVSASEWLDFVEKYGQSIKIPEKLSNVKFDDNHILVIAHVRK